MLTIKSIKLSDINSNIIEEGSRNRLSFRDGLNCHYFGGFINDNLVCLTCLVINKNKTASIKSNFTLKEHRKKGYFTELNRHCLNFAKEQGVKRILLNCLEDSKGIHIKQGARMWKTTKTIFWLVYDKDGF